MTTLKKQANFLKKKNKTKRNHFLLTFQQILLQLGVLFFLQTLQQCGKHKIIQFFGKLSFFACL
jgi:hypothetical protein